MRTSDNKRSSESHNTHQKICARRPVVEFEESDEYFRFLKRYFYECKPQYYSIFKSVQYDTPCGPAHVLVLTTDLCDPHYTPVAICLVNRQKLLLIDDKFYIAGYLQCPDCSDHINHEYGHCHNQLDSIVIVYQLAESQDGVIDVG